MSLGLRALLLDLDGTLVDSRRDIARACNAALVAVGRPELDEARVVSFVGDGARLLLARALEVDASAPIVDEALEPFLESYLAHPVEHTVLLPGVRETLAHLVERGVLLALATNKPPPRGPRGPRGARNSSMVSIGCSRR
jgi:phosphoglycolate phosphatase